MESNVFTVYLQSNGKQSLNIYSKNLWICTLTDNAIAEPKKLFLTPRDSFYKRVKDVQLNPSENMLILKRTSGCRAGSGKVNELFFLRHASVLPLVVLYNTYKIGKIAWSCKM